MDITRTRKGSYSIQWTKAGGSLVDLGSVDNVKPDLTLVLDDIKVGTMGKAVLGKRIVGLTGMITSELREIDAAQYQALMPWYSSGSIPLTPATFNMDLYTYAGLLTLHPNDVGSATTQDVTLLKAVPIITPLERDGEKDEKLMVSWIPFPDRGSFPTLIWGYIGAHP